MSPQDRPPLRQQLKRIGPRLMTLYLLLLLIPIVGIAIYGHAYLQQMLTQAALASNLDEVAVRASAIDALLSHMHGDILYLEQRIQQADTGDSLPSDPSAELNALAASHQMYRNIVLLDADGTVLAGHGSDLPAAGLDQLLPLPLNSIRFVPLLGEDGEPLLVAGARLAAGLLVFEINSAHLLRVITNTADSIGWTLFLPPDIILTADSAGVMPDVEQMTGRSGSVSLDSGVDLYHTAGPGSSWLLIRSVPNSAITPNLIDYYTTLFLIVVGGFIAVFGLALWAIAYIIGPVYQLEHMVDQLRQGVARPALPASIPDDELGKLITVFDQMAEELEHKRQNERALIEQLIRAQEEERKLLAYDLHDGLIQELVGARLFLGQVRKACPPPLDQRIEDSYGLLTHAIAEGRRIIQGLHPTVLEDLGLEAALNELGKSMAQAAGWRIHLDIQPLAVQPDRATSVIVYRITQEALNNAFKHAGAQQVWLCLEDDDGRLRMSIRDDGRGFDISACASGQGWGIETMQERAVMLLGQCTIQSVLGQGTTVQLCVPYHQLQEERLVV